MPGGGSDKAWLDAQKIQDQLRYDPLTNYRPPDPSAYSGPHAGSNLYRPAPPSTANRPSAGKGPMSVGAVVAIVVTIFVLFFGVDLWMSLMAQ